jgi:hypothetical protein
MCGEGYTATAFFQQIPAEYFEQLRKEREAKRRKEFQDACATGEFLTFGRSLV